MNGPADAWHNDPNLIIKVLKWPEVVVSYEVWGEPEDPPELPDGWWDEDTVCRVQDAVKALASESLYEGGKMENGVSVRFLQRMTILQDECGLMTKPHEVALVAEARAAMETSGAQP